jgi:hypothetical protein
MASVIDLAPTPRASPTPSYRKIRAASRGLEVMFTALLVFFVALMLVSLWILLFYQGNVVSIGPRGGMISFDGHPPPDFIPFREWRLDQKLAYVPVVIVRALPSLVLFWCLRALFRLYGQGQVFGRRNAALIKTMGVCLIADAIAPFACHVVLNATGYEIDKMWMHTRALQEVVLGAVVFVIAMVMQAGREIEEDREGFV